MLPDLLANELDLVVTDLVKSKSGMDSGLERGDFGSEAFVQKISRYQPKYLCFNGKRAAKEFLLKNVDYGLQEAQIGQMRLFVAPSTSGAANKWWDSYIKLLHLRARWYLASIDGINSWLTDKFKK